MGQFSLRIYAYGACGRGGGAFWRDRYNLLDAAVVGVDLVLWAAAGVDVNGLGALRVVRMVKVRAW